jgi:ABC-type multidrug transport system fused ATPase/permease subunit
MHKSNLTVVTDYFTNHPYITAGYAVAMVTFPLAVVVVPAVGGSMVDNIKSNIPFKVWRWKLVALIGMMALIIATYMLGTYLDSFATADFTAYVRRTMFDRIVSSRAYDYSPVQVTSTIAKMIMIPYGCFDIVKQFRNTFIPGLITMIAIIVYCFWVDWRIGVFMSVLLVGMVGVMVGGTYTCQDGLVASEYGSERLLERQGDVLETLRKTLMVDAREQEAARREKDFKVQRELTKDVYNCANHFTALVKVMVGLTLIGVILYAYTRYRVGLLPSSKMMSLLFVLMCSQNVLFNAMGSFPSMLRNNSDVIKLGHYLDELDKQIKHSDTDTRDTLHNASKTSDTPSLVFDNVVYAYPSKRINSRTNAVDNMSFSLAPNDAMLVQGTIGCGKSTMALLALGLHVPQSGDIRINGYNIKDLSRKDLDKLIAYVPQQPEMLNRTVYDNLTHGHPEITKAQVEAKMNEFGVNFIGVDDGVGKSGSRLSGGQKLILTLIGAMLQDTPVIIADEITANLDQQTKEMVVDILNAAAVDRVLVFISHDPPPGVRFTRRMHMDKGRSTVTT